MVNGIVSLISVSDLLLPVYESARGFYALTLYSVTLPNSLISSNKFSDGIFRISVFGIMSPANRNSFTSFPT